MDLENLKCQLEQTLKQIQIELEETKQKLSSSTCRRDEKLPYASGNQRQIESMYLQLKEQFQEKCQVLDATRAELFCANEEILKRQKEYEEEHVFDQSWQEKRLHRHIVKLGKEFEFMQELYQREVDDLMQLVNHLLRINDTL